MDNFYTIEELKELGFKHLGGDDIKISKKASIFRPERMFLGNHVRIDDFCLLSGNITIGNYVHIAAYSGLFAGTSEIVMEDFSGLAFRCTIVAESDDYSGEYMMNPTIDMRYRNITKESVYLRKHVTIGTGSVVLPGVDLGEGCSFGAMSLINKSTDPWGIYVGSPIRRVKERKKTLLDKEKLFLNERGEK